jgi:uncharacterized repeat protein (TIGR03803 family)
VSNNRSSFKLAFVISATLFCFACPLAFSPATAQNFQILHDFCAEQRCTDGAYPSGPLLRDTAGDLFGTTSAGGNFANTGVAFEMTPNGDGTYDYNVLYKFCQQAQCTDGQSPYGSLIMDTSGDLFGVTGVGGANDAGVVFELLPGKGNWRFRVLYNFCSRANCDDGETPMAGLTYAGAAAGELYDGNSPLYGTTESGDGKSSIGVAYSLQPAKRGWNEKVIFRIGQLPGAGSQSPLIMDSLGNLYGTEIDTSSVFELSPSNGKWIETVLDDRISFPDGLVMAPSGTLWGLTVRGGGRCRLKGYGPLGCGSIYSLTPGSNGYTETTWHAFCVTRDPDCTDGALPWDVPVLDSQGNLFGTTSLGGSIRRGNGGDGTLFELSSSGTFTVLHSFCEHGTCSDGLMPHAGVTIDPSGNLYGTTQGGGKYKGGVVYEYTP